MKTILLVALGAIVMWYGNSHNSATIYVEGMIMINLSIVLRKKVSLNHL